MAEQIPFGVATSLFNTLASLASRETASIYGIKTEITKLKRTVDAIKAVLADADADGKQKTMESIVLWIKELKEVLYEADDLFDEIHTLTFADLEGFKRKEKVKEGFKRKEKVKGKGKAGHFFPKRSRRSHRLNLYYKAGIQF